MKKTIMKLSSLHKAVSIGLLTAALALPMSATAEQAYFPSAEVAANVLVVAVARHDRAALRAMLGDDYRKLLPVDQIHEDDLDRFFHNWASYHALIPKDANTRMLAVGENGWTLPIPIVRDAQGWRFDTVAGGDLMRIRAIGRNELSVMQAALAYHDAQEEYAAVDHDGDGVREFAQKFLSSPGKQDGLYWEAAPGTAQSPLGPLFAGELPEQAYHGYHYRILTAQGDHAPGGKADYIAGGNMTGGFGLVAWPADYGSSGVMSFMLSRDGVLYEADLGPDGAKLAAAMSAFDPDPRWMRVPAEFIGM